MGARLERIEGLQTAHEGDTAQTVSNQQGVHGDYRTLGRDASEPVDRKHGVDGRASARSSRQNERYARRDAHRNVAGRRYGARVTPADGSVETALYRSSSEELDDVVWKIKTEHLQRSRVWNDMAVIAHDNATVRAFGERLRADGVPVRYSSVTPAVEG